jgi:hypothetical protein
MKRNNIKIHIDGAGGNSSDNSVNKLFRRSLAVLCLAEIFALAYLYFINSFDGFIETGSVPMILGLCFAGVFFSRRPIAHGLTLALFSIGLCLFAMDAACLIINQPLRFISHQREERARQLGVAYDIRGIPQVIQDLRDQGLDAVPQIAPNLMLDSGEPVFPLGGVSQRTVVLCNESGEFSVYPSDEHGFNNPKGLYNSSLTSLIVGDSFANGACVRPGEDIAGQLRLQGLAALTLGMWGNGPLVELASLAEYGGSLRPKYVFWLYYENDMEDLASEERKPLLQNYLKPGFSQNLMDRQPEIDKRLLAEIDKQYQKKIEEIQGVPSAGAAVQSQSVLRGALELLHSQLFINAVSIVSLHDIILFVRSVFCNPYPKENIKRFHLIMGTAKRLSASWGGQLIFVFLPDFFRYQPVSIIKKLNSEGSKRQILGVARQLGLPVIDIDDVFQAQEDPVAFFPLRMMGHYTPQGYALIASILRQAVARPEAAFHEREGGSKLGK